MAVEAHHLIPIFSSQFFPNNRQILNPMEANGTQTMMYGSVPLLGSTMTTTTDCLIPQSVKPAIQSVESSVTFNGDINGNHGRILSVSSSSLRKRSREEDSVTVVDPPSYLQFQKPCDGPIMFLGHDMSLNFQHQQLDVDRLISLHMERMRLEIERQGRRIMEAIEQRVMRRLRAKDEEIEKMRKVNLLLEEKVKSLCVENQIWRDLAQSNEATANALRSNLQEVIAVVEGLRPANADAGDEESCCGSNGGRGEEVREEEAHDRKRVRRIKGMMRECRSCGEGEACVLVLPCRHLSLCSLCGSSVHSCPVCKSPKNASVHVNLSS